METLQVALGRRSYPIYIGGGLLEKAPSRWRSTTGCAAGWCSWA